jgi:acylphosphatase
VNASDQLARLDATIRGRVQGVGYRYFVLRVAAPLPVTGWVANEPDGSVRCVAEGRREVLEELLATLRKGPPAAHVDAVDVTWTGATGAFMGFGVRAGGHTGD